MARRALGGIRYLVDLKGRRRAAAALRRALPELGGGEVARLVRESYARESRRQRSERRAGKASAVELCRRLRFAGWESLHNTPRDPLFLFAPLGSVRVAERALGLYHEGSRNAVVLPAAAGGETVEAALFRRGVACSAAPARRALEDGLPAIWTLAIPEDRSSWAVYYLPPVPTRPDDTVVSLTERYLGVLEAMIREHPEDWPWRHLG